MKRIFLLLLGLISSATVLGGDADHVSVDNLYIRQAPVGAQATGGFMVIRNNGTEAITLVGAESDIAAITELHNHVNEGGVMKMRPVSSINIAARGEVVLQPGSLHVMLIGLQKNLEAGEQVSLALVFADGSRKTLQAEVRNPVGHLKSGH